MPHIKQLDGLRALCILFTLLNHIADHPWYLNGTVGVDVFFALSGFLITSLLLADLRHERGPCLGCFYIRRFFRIVPLYYTVFAVYVLAAVVLNRLGQAPDKFVEMQYAWPSVVTFMSEYRPPQAGTFFGHAWTLGIEEKYYLLWPLLFLGLQRLSHAQQIVLLAALFVAEVLLLPDVELRGYGGLTIGSLVAIAISRKSRLSQRLLLPPAVCVAAVAASYGAVLWVQDGSANILVAVTSALLIAGIVNGRGAVSSVLGWKPLAALGRLTYGIYLIHVLVANVVAQGLHAAGIEAAWWLKFPIIYVVSVAAAALLKVVLEDPLIAVGRQLAVRFRAGRQAAQYAPQSFS